ncbi:MAG: DUF3592 domain-containing protein [Clostridia bacterium]|nr:DUF3592 domain-containing protein [Clostridia bacterium]
MLWLAILILALCVGIMAYRMIREICFLVTTRNCRIFTEGTVSTLSERRQRYGSVFSPTVTYQIDGTEYLMTTHHSYSYSTYRIGEPVKLLVDEATPTRAILPQSRKKALGAIAIYLVATLFILILGIGTIQNIL